MKHAIHSLEYGITYWEESVKECTRNIDYHHENIQVLKEGKQVEGDGDWVYEGLTTVEEKVNSSLQEIDKLIQQRKEYEGNIQEIKEAKKILRQYQKQNKINK